MACGLRYSSQGASLLIVVPLMGVNLLAGDLGEDVVVGVQVLGGVSPVPLTYRPVIKSAVVDSGGGDAILVLLLG